MVTVRTITIKIANLDKIDKNIAALQKAIDRESLTVADVILLTDIKSLLEGIKFEQQKLNPAKIDYYLACPYSDPDPIVRERRYLKVMEATSKLLISGKVVFTPILMTHELAIRSKLPYTSDFYDRFNYTFLSNCSKLIVLMLQGWEESIGIKKEVNWARGLRILVEYTTFEDIGYLGI